jgi:hypothetical protein
LGWVAYLAVGQNWPKGDEDKLHQLGEAWDHAARELVQIADDLGPMGTEVLKNVGGQVGEQFQDFLSKFQENVPNLGTSSGQLGNLGSETAVQLQYAKYMILVQMIWLAGAIASFIFWAPDAIPGFIASARVAVMMILKRLLISTAFGVGFMGLADVAVQGIQILKGDRTKWSKENSFQALEGGAIGGAIGGVLFGGASVFVPKFEANIFGKMVLGGVTGAATFGAMNTINHQPFDDAAAAFGSASAGIVGSLMGGGRFRFGPGKAVKVDPVHVKALEVPKFEVAAPPELNAAPLPGGFPLDRLVSEPSGADSPSGSGGMRSATDVENSSRLSGPAAVASAGFVGRAGGVRHCFDRGRADGFPRAGRWRCPGVVDRAGCASRPGCR